MRKGVLKISDNNIQLPENNPKPGRSGQTRTFAPSFYYE